MTTNQPMSSLTSALIEACNQQDLHAIKKLIRRGAAPNAPSEHGQFPLLVAAWKSDTPTIKTLVQLGGKPHITQHDVETPITIAQRDDLPSIN